MAIAGIHASYRSSMKSESQNSEQSDFEAAAGKDAESSDKIDYAGIAQLQSAGANGSFKAGQKSDTENDYVKHNSDGTITLTAPGSGDLSAHGAGPRTEFAGNAFKLGSGSHALHETTAVTKFPSSGDVVIAQLHEKTSDGKQPRPPIEIHYNSKGELSASILENDSGSAGRKSIDLGHVTPGEPIDLSLTTNASGNVSIDVNGQSKTVQLDPSFSDTDLYFKAGLYNQGSGSQDSEAILSNLSMT